MSSRRPARGGYQKKLFGARARTGHRPNFCAAEIGEVGIAEKPGAMNG
jgi:hypothetical protein